MQHSGRDLGFAHGDQLREWREKPGREPWFSPVLEERLEELLLCFPCVSELQPLNLQQMENKEGLQSSVRWQLFKARKEFRAKCDCSRGEGKSHCNPCISSLARPGGLTPQDSANASSELWESKCLTLCFYLLGKLCDPTAVLNTWSLPTVFSRRPIHKSCSSSSWILPKELQFKPILLICNL